MKPAAILSLAFALASTCAVSQQAATHNQLLQLSQTRTTAPANCPVGLEVRHGSLLERKLVADPAPGRSRNQGTAVLDGGQRIVLSLQNLRSQQIVSARFTVRGFSRQERYVPLAAASPAEDLAQPVEIAVAVKGNGRASRDLALARFSAVTLIDVDAVTYGDGSVWHTPAPNACSASPNPLMLVSGAE